MNFSKLIRAGTMHGLASKIKIGKMVKLFKSEKSLPKEKYDLFVFAGESSGDLHAREIIKDLKGKVPNLKIFAVSGPEMQKEKIETIMSIERFQIMGFSSLFFSFFKILKNFFYLKKTILKKNPTMALFIDYPDFSLRLQKALRKKGYKGKIIHYICPSVWAWRSNRIKLMQKNLDLLICIYPFEKELLSDKLNIQYVQNPLISKIDTYPYDKNWQPLKKEIIALFPGSRTKEIQNNLFMQLLAAKQILKENPNVYFGLSIVSKEKENLILDICKSFYSLKENSFQENSFQENSFQENPFQENSSTKRVLKECHLSQNSLQERIFFVPSNQNYDLMNNCKYALATSGTINLELALHKVPTLVTYKVGAIDLFIVKNIFKISLPYYCIVNILAQKMIFPELYGPNFTKENLFYYLEKFSKEEYLKEISKECDLIKKNLYSNSNFDCILQLNSSWI